MNDVKLSGRLTKDIEIRKTNTGKSVTQFDLAVYRAKDVTDYVPCVAWEKTADMMYSYTHKGSLIIIEGRLQTRTYDGQDGKKHKLVEVLVNRFEPTEKRDDVERYKTSTAPQNSPSQPQNNNGWSNYQQSQNSAPQGDYGGFGDVPINPDDLPF